MVWNSFSWSIEHYYQAVVADPSLIDQARAQKHSPTLYRELIWLHEKLKCIGMREDGASKYFEPTERDVLQFLTDEAKLI